MTNKPTARAIAYLRLVAVGGTEHGTAARRRPPDRGSTQGPPRRSGRWWVAAGSAACIAATSLLVTGFSTANALTPSNGTVYAGRATVPRGAVFINDGQGGHWWVGDSNLGLCRLDAQNVAGQPPFAENTCNGTAKNGGQIVVGPSPVAGQKYLYVADDSSKSTSVVRFTFTPGAAGAAGSVSAPLTMRAPNATNVGGGAAGGRPVALALAPNGVDLYVGYLKSGDIMKITGAGTTASATPPIARVGVTSDGRGVNSFAMFGNDLYVAESGGAGLSVVQDPSGVSRAACTAASVCIATTVSPSPSSFPGGLASDGTYLYIGDSPTTGNNNSIIRFNPANGTWASYSTDVSPSYVSGGTTFTQYAFPYAIGVNPANGDVLVGDDPQAGAATPVLQQGHFWKVPHPAVVVVPSVTSVAPASGSSLGGDVVTVTGTNLAAVDGAGAVTTLPSISFGGNAGVGVACASATTCTVTSPPGTGTADVRVTLNGQTSAAVATDQFQFVVANPTQVTITKVTPSSGATIGGTKVTITGTNFDPASTTIAFGSFAATAVTCASSTSCTATTPAEAAGAVDVVITDVNGTSASVPADRFTFVTPTAGFFSWGVTAPKGGAVWLPGALGGHWWSSDHSQGLCRQDPVSTAPAPFNVPGDRNFAINLAACGDDAVGSAGQAAYDPRPVVDLATGAATTLHYVYVPDNAVKSTAVWRLTFDPATETMVADPNGGALATAMIPLANVRTLKPNGLALGPDGNLYVSDLTEANIRRITNPAGDPRTQTVSIVAVTGDGRGANGTQGFIGNLLYVAGNRAAQFFDVTQCPLPGGAPCGMASVPAPSGVFVAGVATDAAHQMVYLSDSPGGAGATVYRYDASQDVYVPFAPGTYVPDAFGVVTCTACTMGPTARSFVTGGTLPAPGTPGGTVTCALTCQRPYDTAAHPTTAAGFSFAFGLSTDPQGNLAITEDPSAGARAGRGTMWVVPFVA
jgi:hypothetical protein